MDTPTDIRLSIVIPLYNSAEILPHLLDRLEATVPHIAPEHETILVNDGSPDDTWARVQREITTRPHLVALNLMRNYGRSTWSPAFRCYHCR